MNNKYQPSPPTTCTLQSTTNYVPDRITGETLCIGLDIAWFGGSANDRDSQYDCLASVVISPDNTQKDFRIRRVKLKDRDPYSERLLEVTDDIIKENEGIDRIVFAIDAPIQAITHDLPPREPSPSKGMIQRRACENQLDKFVSGNDGWRPRIQPGAPMAPRVIYLLEGLKERGFNLWTPENQHSKRLLIECFPSEAIWAVKQMGYYPDNVNATCVKAYKKQKGNLLSTDQVQSLVHNVLDGFAPSTGNVAIWSTLVNQTIKRLLNEKIWQYKGKYRGGKILDDSVDTMICLATSLSYTNNLAHVWQDPQQTDDGHIIGPGFLNNGKWTPACNNHIGRGET